MHLVHTLQHSSRSVLFKKKELVEDHWNLQISSQLSSEIATNASFSHFCFIYHVLSLSVMDIAVQILEIHFCVLDPYADFKIL